MFENLKFDFARLISSIQLVKDFRKTYRLETPDGLEKARAFSLTRWGTKFSSNSSILGFYHEIFTATHRSELFDIVASQEPPLLAASPLKQLLADLVNIHGGAKGVPLFLRTDDDLPVENAIPGEMVFHVVVFSGKKTHSVQFLSSLKSCTA